MAQYVLIIIITVTLERSVIYAQLEDDSRKKIRKSTLETVDIDFPEAALTLPPTIW
jgi:hypothetical protein